MRYDLMGEQRRKASLLTVDLASVTVELNLRESGARFPCKWSSVLEIYRDAAPCGRYLMGLQEYMNMKYLEAAMDDASIVG